MKKKEGNIKGFLYEKTKEHPAIRFSRYWDLPQELLLWAFSDIFVYGYSISDSLYRLNYTIALMGRELDRHKFGNFIEAGKKYETWMSAGQKRHHALPLGSELVKTLRNRKIASKRI